MHVQSSSFVQCMCTSLTCLCLCMRKHACVCVCVCVCVCTYVWACTLGMCTCTCCICVHAQVHVHLHATHTHTLLTAHRNNLSLIFSHLMNFRFLQPFTSHSCMVWMQSYASANWRVYLLPSTRAASKVATNRLLVAFCC